jgi:hypothetical protein
LYFER